MFSAPCSFKFPGGLPSIGTMLNLLNMIGSDFNINSQQIGPSVPSLAFSANRPPICELFGSLLWTHDLYSAV